MRPISDRDTATPFLRRYQESFSEGRRFPAAFDRLENHVQLELLSVRASPELREPVGYARKRKGSVATLESNAVGCDN
jgi:hypothetical protein